MKNKQILYTLRKILRRLVLRKKIVLIFLMFNVSVIYSQSDWVNYLVEREKGLMSVHVDLGLNYLKPNYKNLLIVGSRYDGCMSNGFPTEQGLNKLYVFSDSLSRVVKRLTKNRLVGILTYQCYGFDVFYVKDTTGLRNEISRLIIDNFEDTKSYITMKYDRKWVYYYENIFPLNAPNDFFTDHEYLTEMVAKGDDLEEARLVTHWIKFRKEKKMIKFVNEAKELNFNVDSLYAGKDKIHPFEVELSRKDIVSPKSINTLTNTLKVLSRNQGGVYDGWGADVIIEEQE
jgi:hypothetical protein